MEIPWGMPETQWFCLKPPILSILSVFQLLKNLKKQILQQTTLNICETGHNNITFTTVEQKIAWEYLGYAWDTVILLKTAYFKHFEHFPVIEKKNFYCKPLWIRMKLVTITWLSLLLSIKLHGNTLRHAWDTVILLKTAYFKHFERFPAIEKFKKTNFAANHFEYVWNWSQ